MAGEKPRVICPYCQRDGQTLANGQAAHYSVNGMTAHVRKKHPADYMDWHTNKADYVKKYSCDAAGNPIAKKGGEEAGYLPTSSPPRESLWSASHQGLMTAPHLVGVFGCQANPANSVVLGATHGTSHSWVPPRKEEKA